ncbi:MAG: 3'-5' exonuclease [Verrucomicrobiota bacterium]
MPKAIIFDTETTGLNAPEVIEAAWLELLSLSPLKFGDSFEQRYKPNKPISLAALATHHILDEELVDSPPSDSFKLPKDTQYLIGHNVDYDWEVIGYDEPSGAAVLLNLPDEELNGVANGFHGGNGWCPFGATLTTPNTPQGPARTDAFHG